MSSLLDCYKNLFSISETINLNECFNTIYTITLLQYNYDLNSNKSNTEFSTSLYYIFIHLLIGIIQFYKKNSDVHSSDLLENEDILDYELIKFIFSLLDMNALIFKIELFQNKILFVTVTKDKILDLKKIIDENYSNFQNEDFYDNLITIQYLDIILHSSNNLSFQTNQADKKSFGKFYSPERLTSFIIRIFNKFKNADPSVTRVLDPSCGSGLFLWTYLKFLFEKNSIENNNGSVHLEGIDIDYKSLLTAKIMIKLLQMNKILAEKSFVIKFRHKDYLLTDPDTENLFNLIIGNPPYIRERFFDKGYRTKLKKFTTYKGKSDIYFAFIEHSYKYLIPGGYLVFILPRYWIESEFGIGLREFIKSYFSIELLIDFRNFKIFNIGVHSLILIAKKISVNNNLVGNTFRVISIKESAKKSDIATVFSEIEDSLTRNLTSFTNIITFSIKQNNLDQYWQLQPFKYRNLVNKLRSQNELTLSSIAIIKEGINTGADRISARHRKILKNKQLNVGEGIFVLTTEELDQLQLPERERNLYIKKWIKGKDVDKWNIKNQNLWLIYFIKDLDSSSGIYKHLLKYKEILEHRAEIKRNNKRKWFEIAWPRTAELFETREKILIRYKSQQLIGAIDQNQNYTSADFRIIIVKKPFNPYVLLGILNSDLINWLLKKQSKKLGKIHDFYSYILKEIPIIYPEKEKEQKIEILVKNIIKIKAEQKEMTKKMNDKTNLIPKLEKTMNEELFSLYNLTEKEIELIKNEQPI